MTQIMMVPPTAPPAQTDVSQIGTSSGDQFSSHLDSAIKADNKQDSHNTPTDTPQHTLKEDSKTVKTDSFPEIPDTNLPATSIEIAGLAEAGRTTIGNDISILIAEMTPDNPITAPEVNSPATSVADASGLVADASGLENLLKNEAATVTVNSTNISIPEANFAAVQNGPLLGARTDQQAASTTNQLFTQGQVPQTPSIEAPLFSLLSQESPSFEVLSNPQLLGAQSKNIQGQEALLAQIQKIIDNSSETGIVTVKSAGAPLDSPTLTTSIAQTTLAAATSPATPLQQSSVLIEGNVLKTAGEKSEASLTTLRQDSQQQYYEAKINPQNNSEQNSNSDNKQQNESGTPQPSTSPQTGLSQTTTGPTSDYAQVAAPATQSLVTEPLVDTVRPAMLPSGAVFTEDEVIQQLVERFQITKRQLETKLNIKLHPAELGELKIDLNIKDGHIRAVVVAQSLQVQEIIEKNLAKLRSAFEDQGFSIDEILVTSESDSVGDFDLFDKNLSGGNNYIPSQMKKDNNYANSEFTLEEVSMNPLPSNIGVNVKA